MGKGCTSRKPLCHLGLRRVSANRMRPVAISIFPGQILFVATLIESCAAPIYRHTPQNRRLAHREGSGNGKVDGGDRNLDDVRAVCGVFYSRRIVSSGKTDRNGTRGRTWRAIGGKRALSDARAGVVQREMRAGVGSNWLQVSAGETSWSCRRHSRLAATLAPKPELKTVRPGMLCSRECRSSARCRHPAQHRLASRSAAVSGAPRANVEVPSGFTVTVPGYSSTMRTRARTARSRWRY